MPSPQSTLSFIRLASPSRKTIQSIEAAKGPYQGAVNVLLCLQAIHDWSFHGRYTASWLAYAGIIPCYVNIANIVVSRGILPAADLVA
jgi:hypothetical protein